jgi:hypothetical protein
MSDTADVPSDFLLHSFNGFTITEPDEIYGSLIDCLQDDSALSSGNVHTQTIAQTFEGKYVSETSAQSIQTKFTLSTGVDAAYAEFSGSIQTEFSQDEYVRSTAFNSNYQATINLGTCSYQYRDPTAILALMKPDFVSELNAIADFTGAAQFTDNWGTHLVTGVNLGGSLFIAIQDSTHDTSENMAISTSVQAAYKGAGSSISATADAAYSVETTSSTANVSQSVKTVGGSGILASQIDPADKQSFIAWANSCTDQSVSGFLSTRLIYELLPAGSLARTTLQSYCNLRLLAQSINHPTIVCNRQSLAAGQIVSVSVAAPGPGYKILSGGAGVPRTCSSFLIGSYPIVSSSGIGTWAASCHDSKTGASSSQYISVYAMVVYDPCDYLTISVSTGVGANTGGGASTASAPLPAAPAVLAGGGCNSSSNNAGIKFLISSYPDAGQWKATSRDYISGAKNCTLTSYAVGVACSDARLVLSSQWFQGPVSSGHHDSSISNSGSPISGGGVWIEGGESGNNLVQEMIPATPTTWTEYNTDANGRGATYNAYAYSVCMKAELVTS